MLLLMLLAGSAEVPAFPCNTEATQTLRVPHRPCIALSQDAVTLLRHGYMLWSYLEPLGKEGAAIILNQERAVCHVSYHQHERYLGHLQDGSGLPSGKSSLGPYP